MKDFLLRSIAIILSFGIIYFVGCFIAWDTNPLNWWLFTSTFGRIITIILFILIITVNFKED